MARRPLLSKLPIIMLASERSQSDQEMIRRLGITRYLAKPFRRSDLFNAIMAIIGAQTALPLPSSEGEGQTVSRATRPLRILLVEDFADNRRMIELYLKKNPYQLDMAPNGQVAVEMFTHASYDLVLMDIQMPVMDGYQATGLIRKWEADHHRPPTPILALTANALKGEVQKSLTAGCTGHLVKPIRKAQLLQAIMQHTEGRPANDVPVSEANPEGRLVLEVSAELEELMPKFLANRRRDVEQIIAELANGDFERIRALGHGIKGAGGTYGSAVISRLGEHIEQAAVERNAGAIEADVTALNDYLERVELVFV
jgi:CheY-like chemotaxis protein